MDKNHVLGPPLPNRAMVGNFTRKDQIPDKAVFLSENDVYGLVQRTISNWKPRSEMWPFKYGAGIYCGAASISAYVFNLHMRNKFRVGNFGPMLTFGPICVIPMVTTMVLQEALILKPLALQKFDCPSCAQLRSSALLVSTGIIQPCIMSIVVCSLIAKHNYTIPLPPIVSKKIITTYINMLKPMRRSVMGLFVMNVAVSFFITDHQAKCMDKVHDKLSQGIK